MPKMAFGWLMLTIVSITYCKFFINDYGDPAGGGAAIELSGEWTDSTMTNTTQSDYNLITNNYIELSEEAHDEINVQANSTNLWHGIYMSRSSNNLVKYNTIENSFGNGIQFWHENIVDNDVQHNFIYIKHSTDNDIRHNILIGKDFLLGEDDDIENLLPVSGNTITDNYINTDFKEPKSLEKSHYDSFSGFGVLNNLVVRPQLKSSNTTTSNSEFFFNPDSLKAIDPLHLGFDDDLDIIEQVSGDFDGDQKKDDIATLVSTGPNASAILVWIKQDPKPNGKDFFNYQGAWWESDHFDATQLEGRLVAGDFNNDGKWDVAGLRDLGNNNASMVVFRSSGAHFDPDGHGYIWWNSTSFDVSQFTGRTVAGDFDGDGNLDIAGLRDLGNNNSSIEVFESDGTEFTLNGGGVSWWDSDHFDVTQLTGRVVAGDFDNNGKWDIAGMRYLGNNSSKIVVFKSDGSEFDPDGYGDIWWESTNFNVTQLTGRVVAGDFTGEGNLDIAGLRDLGNGSSTMVLFVGVPTQEKFYPDGYGYVRWSSGTGEFDATETLTLLDVDLAADGSPDLVTFKKLRENYRTIAWYESGGYFTKSNELGIPWLIGPATSTPSLLLTARLPKLDSLPADIPKTVNFFNFPNPFKNQTTISFYNQASGKVKINIISINGAFSREILNTALPAGHHLLDFSKENLVPGIYFLELHKEGKSFYHKLVISP